MPLPKKLTCAEVSDIASKFFGGFSIKAISEHFKVSRVTITRLLERTTYKDCANMNTMVASQGLPTYLERLDQQMEVNKRTGRGNRKEITC